jgi:hypothetical protein
LTASASNSQLTKNVVLVGQADLVIWSRQMHEFSQSQDNRQIVSTTDELKRELDETWRAMLRDSERPYIYGTTLLSRLRAEHALYVSFLIRRAIRGVAVPDEPHFDELAGPYFFSLIGSCRFYLEYGSGGSTVLAAALKKPFVSVDTDRLFLQSLRRKIGTLTPDQRLIHADIGRTGPWGIPFPAGEPSSQRLRKWKAYAETPWRFISKDNHPDLVLVDGRFRVATALTCCVHLGGRSDVQILIDDYADRPAYHVIEQHAKLVRIVGRMAVFHPLRGNKNPLTEIINQSSSDWL